METPASDRGRFLYLYSQCSEVGRVKWHISEECFCRGFKLKPDAVMKPAQAVNAQLAEVDSTPVRIVNLTDAEALEAQLIELSIVGKSFRCLHVILHVVYM